MLVVGGVHVSNLTVILDYGFTAVLLFMAARSFAKVADDTSNQLRLVFQARSRPYHLFCYNFQSARWSSEANQGLCFAGPASFFRKFALRPV